MFVASMAVMANFVFFLHAQVDSRGVWIVHAHPYSNGDRPLFPPYHSHTLDEILLLQGIAQMEIPPLLCSLAEPLQRCLCVCAHLLPLRVERLCAHFLWGRSPPRA